MNKSYVFGFGGETLTYLGAEKLPEYLLSFEPIRNMANEISMRIPSASIDDVVGIGIIALGTALTIAITTKYLKSQKVKPVQSKTIYPEFQKQHNPIKRDVWYQSDAARQFDIGGSNDSYR